MSTRPATWLRMMLTGTALLSAVPASAQVTLSADATRATVHYDGYQRSPVWLLSPVARFERRTFALVGRGNLSIFQSGNRSTDLTLGASVYPPALASWRPEIAGTGGISRYLGNNTGYGSMSVRAHRIARTAGLWLGGSTTAVTGGTEIINGVRAEAGGWARAGPLAVSVMTSRTSVADIGYLDFGLHGRYTRHWLEISGGVGGRAGDPTLGLRNWGDIAATAWLTRRVAIVAAHGAYPSDPSQLAPGGQYTAISMRIATRPPALREALTRTLGYPTPSIVRPVVAGFEVTRGRDGRTRFRIRAADAATVEVTGTFTDWMPVPLERVRGDQWEVILPVARGTHQLNVRVDGGPWGVPPGVGTAPDDFGGVVGVLIIT